MAVKYFCDGCGYEQKQKDMETFRVIQVKDTVYRGIVAPDNTINNLPVDAFELCFSCAEKFKKQHLPRNWPKASEPCK